MFKLALMATVTFASTLSANAQTKIDMTQLPQEVAARVAELQTYGDRYQAAIDAIIREASMADYRWESPAEVAATSDFENLSEEVAAQVALLQSYGSRFDKAIDAILREASMTDYRWESPAEETVTPDIDLTILTDEVADHVALLRSYGGRFDKAIDAILREARMAEYRWENCETVANTVVALAPES